MTMLKSKNFYRGLGAGAGIVLVGAALVVEAVLMSCAQGGSGFW